MEAQEEAFEVASLGMGEVHGMVRPRPEDAEELRGLSRIPDGAEDDLLEELGLDRDWSRKRWRGTLPPGDISPPGD